MVIESEKGKLLKIHIISDTHFSHKNIKEYCNRPNDWEEQIVNNLMALDTDLLIHLGDVSLGNDAAYHFSFGFLSCKCWLILGNHDSKSTTWYMNHGWDFVARNFTMYLYGIRILFSHRPYPFPPMKTVTRELARDVNHAEITKDIQRSNFDINLCGHVHTRKIDLPNWCYPYIIEEEDYKPIELKEFLSEEIKERSKNDY